MSPLTESTTKHHLSLPVISTCYRAHWIAQSKQIRPHAQQLDTPKQCMSVYAFSLPLALINLSSPVIPCPSCFHSRLMLPVLPPCDGGFCYLGFFAGVVRGQLSVSKECNQGELSGMGLQGRSGRAGRVEAGHYHAFSLFLPFSLSYSCLVRQSQGEEVSYLVLRCTVGG